MVTVEFCIRVSFCVSRDPPDAAQSGTDSDSRDR
jgi:hypothetical protein